MVSAKEIDQLAVKAVEDMKIVTLPAVGLTHGHRLRFLRGFIESYRVALKCFSQQPPQAVLAMGGFTSAPPVLAARRLHARTFLHESNSIPGRANRWLSWIVDRAFVAFPSAGQRLRNRRVTVTGTPVRPKFRPSDPGPCRLALGLDPDRPMALVMGGSQGAKGINDLIARSLGLLAAQGPDWQWFHLAGPVDAEKLRATYASHGLAAVVHSFFLEMDVAMGASTASISRAGASSLAELAAMRLPAVLVPFPAATDNHQFYNAQAFQQTGAAILLDQQTAGPEDLARSFGALMRQETVRQKMQAALEGWHRPQAADEIAQAMFESVGQGARPARSNARPNHKAAPDDVSRCCCFEPKRFERGISPRRLQRTALQEGNIP
jgi:UDP-N-acetylglucosamine--N-acetylmuramyl-(pentapeptide) pyrophosphoryl-undecaprenol N-acetylglucosamine transferase